jgi:hypothetical protein
MEPLDFPSEESIDFRTSFIFPMLIRIVAIVPFVLGLIGLGSNWFVGGLFTLIGIFLVTSNTHLKIDFARKRFRSYSVIFGLKFGELDSFEEIECINIHKRKVFLKFSDKRSVLLYTNSDKAKLRVHADVFAARFKCNVVDQTNK